MVVVRCVFCGFFFFFSSSWLCCPLRYQNSRQACLWESFLLCGNFSSFITPPKNGSPSLSLLSLFSSFILCPTSIWRDRAAFLHVWYPLRTFRSCSVKVTQHSTVLLTNLWGRKWSPHPIPLPFWDCPLVWEFVGFLKAFSLALTCRFED